MAGSYAHCRDNDGSFTFDLIENMGEAYEACEDMYDLISELVGILKITRGYVDDYRNEGLLTSVDEIINKVERVNIVQNEILQRRNEFQRKHTRHWNICQTTQRLIKHLQDRCPHTRASVTTPATTTTQAGMEPPLPTKTMLCPDCGKHWSEPI